jgi:threonine/homoserine/homoserine lactone efflux protein
MLAIILFLIVPSDSAATPTTNFLMIVFISIVYWIIFFLCVFIAAKFKKTAKRK